MNPPTPSYLALADELTRLVESSRPGDRLPSENELVASHDVSRLTARAAVQELERRHLVRRVRGSGTFVARRIEYRLCAAMAPSWSRIVRRAGAEPDRVIVGAGRVPAPPVVAEALGVEPGRRVVAITRVGRVDGLVADVGTSWLPDDLVDDLDSFLPDGASLYRALVDRGWEPTRRRVTAELEVVPTETALQLELEGRPLVWRLLSTNVDGPSARPIEFSDGWMRPDVYRVALELGDVS